MEVLKFIFSGFWVWLGVAVLVYMTLYGLAEIVRAFRRERKVRVTSYKDRTRIVEIENATAVDTMTAMWSGDPLAGGEEDAEAPVE